jgi:rubrerythrin
MEKLLREDLAVEELGIKTYGDWAKRFGDKGLKSLFQDLSVDEKGHAQGVISVLRQLEENTLEAVFYCPRCGWVLSLGRSPNPGFRVRCPMCGVTSELVEEEGDFRLEPVDA